MQSPIDRCHDGKPHAAARARNQGKAGEPSRGIDADDNAVAIEGLKFLWGSDRSARRRRPPICATFSRDKAQLNVGGTVRPSSH
jgi:hypothetical protein